MNLQDAVETLASAAAKGHNGGPYLAGAQLSQGQRKRLEELAGPLSELDEEMAQHLYTASLTRRGLVDSPTAG